MTKSHTTDQYYDEYGNLLETQAYEDPNEPIVNIANYHPAYDFPTQSIA